MGKTDFEKMVDEKMGAMRDDVVRETAHEYLRTGFNPDISLAEFVNSLHKEGLWDMLKDLSLKDLFEALFGTAPASKKASERTRLTKADKEKLLESIPAFLQKNSWSKRSDIAKGVGQEAKKLNIPLKELLKAKKIKKQGEKAGVVYAVVGEKERP